MHRSASPATWIFDLEIDAADDLLAAIESILVSGSFAGGRSPRGPGSTPKAMRSLIEEELRSTPGRLRVPVTVGMADLLELTTLDRPDLKYEPWTGGRSPV